MNADCPKQYQLSPVKHLSQHKPGPSRILSLEDEILMTLMRIRLDCPVEDLAFRFGVSVSPCHKHYYYLYCIFKFEAETLDLLAYTRSDNII